MTNTPKTPEASLYERILVVTEAAESLRPFKLQKTQLYKSVKDPTVKFPVNVESKAKMFEAGLNISDFEVVEETYNPAELVREMIFSDGNIDKSVTFKSLSVIENFIGILKEVVTGKTRPEIKLEAKEGKSKSDYAKKYSALKAAIRIAEVKKDEAKKAEKIAELVQLVIDKGDIPKSSFLYMAEYEAAKVAKETPAAK